MWCYPSYSTVLMRNVGISAARFRIPSPVACNGSGLEMPLLGRQG